MITTIAGAKATAAAIRSLQATLDVKAIQDYIKKVGKSITAFSRIRQRALFINFKEVSWNLT